MALLNINFLSQSLCRITTVQMFIPNDLNPEERRENLHYNRPPEGIISSSWLQR